MTTTSAAGKVAGSGVVEKKEESKVEKRRALGRGLGALLPGPRVVSTESRVPSTESSPAAPQGLKPESSWGVSGTAEAVPFPSSAPPVSSGGAGETEIPRFARNDMTGARNDGDVSLDDSGGEPRASGELQADAAYAAGRANAPVPTQTVALPTF